MVQRHPAHLTGELEMKELRKPKPEFTAIDKFYVVRTYSDTEKHTLWKVLSRPMRDRIDADFQRRFESGLPENKKHTTMLVQMVAHSDYPDDVPLVVPADVVVDPAADYTPVERYFVVKTYSHTDRRLLWKVVGSDLTDFDTACKVYHAERASVKRRRPYVMIVRMVVHPDFPAKQ